MSLQLSLTNNWYFQEQFLCPLPVLLRVLTSVPKFDQEVTVVTCVPEVTGLNSDQNRYYTTVYWDFSQSHHINTGTVATLGQYKALSNSSLSNFRFSPCIIIVNHFYCPTNAFNYRNLEVKIYVV